VEQLIPFPLNCSLTCKEGSTAIVWSGNITKEDAIGMVFLKIGTVESWDYMIDRIDFEKQTIFLLEEYHHGKLSKDAQLRKEQIYKAAQLERLVNSPGAGKRKNPNDGVMDFFGAASQLQAAEMRANTADVSRSRRRGEDRLDSEFWEEEEKRRAEEAREKKEKEDRERIDVGTIFEGLLCWRQIKKSEDKRPQWRIDYDDGIVPYGEHFVDSKKFEIHFGVPVSWPYLEELCVDFRGGEPMHFQRLDCFKEVPRDMIVKHTFDTICLTPPAVKNWMDGSKWSKFVKALNLFPPNKARQIMTKIDLAFTRQAVKNKKKKGFIDITGFKSVMKEISLLRFPELRKQNPRQALNDLLYKYCVNIPDVREKVWCDAKLIAMKKEAVVQAAATRIQARVRVVQAVESYRCHLAATVQIESMWRRGNTRSSFRKIRRVLRSDRIFRYRHIQAMQIQKVFRCFLWYKRFKHYQKQRQLETKKRMDLWRQDKRKKRRIREANTFFKLVRNINGQTVMIRITRASLHASAKQDLSMKIEAYVPKTQETFRFKLQEQDIREYMMKVLEVEGLSMGEILDPNHLILISNRLMCRIVNGRPIILLSRRTVAERGIQLMRQAQKLNDGDLYVMTVYRSTNEIALQAFHPKSCDVSRAAISNKVLKEWLKRDERRIRRIQERAKREEIAEARKILKLREVGVVVDDEALLDAFAVLDKHNVGIETRPPTAAPEKMRKGKGKNEGKGIPEAEPQKFDAAAFIRSDSYLTDDTDQTKGTALVSKRRTSTDEQFLGLEMIEDGETSNDPELLREGNEKELIQWLLAKVQIMFVDGARLLLFDFEAEKRSGDASARVIQGLYRMMKAKQRMRQQVRLYFEKRRDMSTKKFYYVNLKTNVTQWEKPVLLGPEDLDDPPDEWREVKGEDGKTYYMNPGTGQVSLLTEDRAAHIIQKLVRRFLSADFGQLPLRAIVTALRLQAFAEKKYREDPERLSNVVNMALLHFTHYHNLDAAKPCFKAALEMAPHNPIVLRAAALFQLARCDPPRWRTFNKAQDMLKEADQRDKDRSKFYITEEAFFHYEVIMTPHHPRALMNFALLMQCVVKDFDRAERFYRRALTESPNDPQLRKNFEDFEERRVPGGAYAGGGPPSSVVKRSMVFAKKPEWGEWSKMKDMAASDDRFQIFWYNKFTMITKWDEPNWKEAWQVRNERSEVVKDLGRWNEMYDPSLEQTYFWNKNTNAFQIKDPFLC